MPPDTVGLLPGAETEVDDGTDEDGLEGAEDEPVELPLKVVPMSPNLMLEKVTEELGTEASTSLGRPEVVAHVPRAIPGTVASLSVG